MNLYTLYLDVLLKLKNNSTITRTELIMLLNGLKIVNKSTIENFINKSQSERIILPINKSIFWKTQKANFDDVALTKDDIKLYKFLSKNFPNINFTIWNTKFFNDFIEHTIPYSNTIIETDKDILEDAYHSIDNFKNIILLNPSKQECEKYMYLKNIIILKKEIKNMPTMILKNKIRVPKLEKILVDLFSEKAILQQYQGNEMVNIYNAIFEKYVINMTTLLRYSKNRGCKEQIISYIKNNISFPKQYKEVLK